MEAAIPARCLIPSGIWKILVLTPLALCRMDMKCDEIRVRGHSSQDLKPSILLICKHMFECNKLEICSINGYTFLKLGILSAFLSFIHSSTLLSALFFIFFVVSLPLLLSSFLFSISLSPMSSSYPPSLAPSSSLPPYLSFK